MSDKVIRVVRVYLFVWHRVPLFNVSLVLNSQKVKKYTYLLEHSCSHSLAARYLQTGIVDILMNCFVDIFSPEGNILLVVYSHTNKVTKCTK